MFITWPPNPSPLSVHCLFISLSVQPVHLPQINTWALSHEFKLVPFHVLHVHVLFKTNGVSFILSCLFQYNTSAMRSEFWVEMYYETRRLKLSNFLWFIKVWDDWYNSWIITQGTGTPCFFKMLITVFLSYLKTNFRLKCLQTSFTCI